MMFEFLDKQIKERKKEGTPNKKIKPNEVDQEEDLDFSNAFIDLVFIKNISKTKISDSIQSQKEKHSFKIQQFQINQNFELQEQNNQNDPFVLNRGTQMQSEQDIKIPSNLKKRMNSMQQINSMDYDNILTELSLHRHNSTFPKANLDQYQAQQIGQNIYLAQSLTLKSKLSLTDANNQNRQIIKNFKRETHLEDNRLQVDFQIKQNLGKHHQNQSFICLNKLQRIFHYVKKVQLKSKIMTQKNKFTGLLTKDLMSRYPSLMSTASKQKSQGQTELISDQIKLYNMDSKGRLVRFYQYWIQNSSIYMIYELASYSLADKNSNGQKLPQSEVWSLLYDVINSLNWIHESGKFHMNIKPGNIIKCRGKYKISDPLVSSQHLEEYLEKSASKGESFYLAPQVIEFQSYLQGIDFGKCEVYSLGLSILQNITVLPSYMKMQSIYEIKNYFRKQVHGYSSFLIRLLLRMVDKNYKKRPQLKEILCQNIEDCVIEGEKNKNEVKFRRSNSI